MFLNKLLLLFKHCHLCFAKNPRITIKQTGTTISNTSACTACDQQFFWQSQPYIFGNYYAGNVLLSFAMLCSGSCIRKTLRVFEQMKICVFNETTYYYHQRHLLIPAIVKFWRSYQDKICSYHWRVRTLFYRETGDTIAWVIPQNLGRTQFSVAPLALSSIWYWYR